MKLELPFGQEPPSQALIALGEAVAALPRYKNRPDLQRLILQAATDAFFQSGLHGAEVIFQMVEETNEEALRRRLEQNSRHAP